MKKVLVAYFSKTGTTETMAEYIAEGVRITGHGADLRKVSEIKSEKDLEGYDGLYFRLSHLLSRYARALQAISIDR